jgi:predicted NBD/HSP70 family sugar kinase
MIIAVDIGGTKTLVASANENGDVVKKEKYPSPKNFDNFVNVLTDKINTLCKHPSIISIGCAGSINRSNGLIIGSPNLGWVNAPLARSVAKKLPEKTVIIVENDANLAALSESHMLKSINQKVMYITFSTGVGTGFVVNGKLEPNLLDSEGGRMVFEHEGKLMDWESFAAGRIIVDKYGKMASELNDPKAWSEIAKNMAIGIADNCAVFQPDTVILGGSVGTYFKKYKKFLRSELEMFIKKARLVKTPALLGAQNAEEAVMLGCIIYAKQYEQRIKSTTGN